MEGHGSKFGRKKEEAIAALLTQRNLEEAARAAGVGRQTLIRWLKIPAISGCVSGSAPGRRVPIQRADATGLERRRIDAVQDHDGLERTGVGSRARGGSNLGACETGNRERGY